jgi:dienelactone hydrolase
MPKVESWFTAVRENEGSDLPIGAAGFCWGGKHVIHLAYGTTTKDGKPLVDASFTAHPSNCSFPAELEKVKKPLSIALGDKDFSIGSKEIEIIKGAFKKLEGVNTEIKVYENCGHGFSIRADPSHDTIKQAKEAETQAVEFFTKNF